MKRYMIGAMLFSTLPFGAVGQEIPLYIDHGGELSFTGMMLNDAELNDMFGGRGIIDIFGVPEIIVKDAKTSAPRPVYASPEEYEVVFGADGQVKEHHDDLTFTQNEGSDLRDDLAFAENEGSDLREDLSFSADDALKTGSNFDGPKDFFSGGGTKRINPQHGTWSVRMMKTQITGCPPGVGEAVAAQAMRSGHRDIAFSHPGWVPADITPDFARFHWNESGINGYHSAPYKLEAEGSGMALSVTFALAAKTKTQIDAWARVRMNLTPMLAQMAGGSETCTALVTGTYFRN